jgi:predicted nucleotidyltransferase
MPIYDLDRMLNVLCDERVEFIIVGGLAAVLQGAPVLTKDVDILYRIEDQNIERLQRALERLNAVARDDPRMLRFNKSHLQTQGQKLSSTDAGPLDILGSINDGVTYEHVLPTSDEIEVVGRVVRVISLDRLVELKRELKRPKDVAMLPVLEATLMEKSKRDA